MGPPGLAVRITLPYKGNTDVMFIYMQDGQEMSPGNSKLVDIAAETADDTQLVIGGAWSMAPTILSSSEAPEQLRAATLHTAQTEPNCRHSQGKFHSID